MSLKLTYNWENYEKEVNQLSVVVSQRQDYIIKGLSASKLPGLRITTRECNKDTDPLKIKMSIATITKNRLIPSTLFSLILDQWNILAPSYKGNVAESFTLCCTMRL